MTSRTSQLFPRHGFAFKGGGGGGGSQQAPVQNTTVMSTPPPPSATSVDVQQAKRDAVKQAGKRKGVQSTILAGETGGYQGQNPLASPDQKKTLLGG
jgi:hypothetical protein